MSCADALSRTLLLMRSDLDPLVTEDQLLAALNSVKVLLCADAATLATHSGQSALVTAALTMARSGHEVWIEATEVNRIGAQPPLTGASLLAGIVEVGQDLLPDCAIRLGRPDRADLICLLGDGVGAGNIDETTLVVAIDATDWSARLRQTAIPWSGQEWPLGGIAAGVLAASEAFRVAMRRLVDHAQLRSYFDDLYAASSEVGFALAPEHTPHSAYLPHFDMISGGAIANAALFALARLPNVAGTGRVLDDDRSALSNLNRNALLRRSALDEFKVVDLARLVEPIALSPQPMRYTAGMPLLPTVLVGVDDIPSRWAAQAADPAWLGVGATEGFSVLVSSHVASQPCVGCLHPVAATPNGPIPTAAFVSLLSGLLLVARWQRALGPEGPTLADQQHFLNALRPEGWSFGAMPLAASHVCPVGCAAAHSRRAA